MRFEFGAVIGLIVLIVVALVMFWIGRHKHEQAAAQDAKRYCDVTPTSYWTVISVILTFTGTLLTSVALMQVNNSLDTNFRQKEIQLYEYLSESEETFEKLLFADVELYPYLKGQEPVDLFTLKDKFPSEREDQLKLRAVRACEKVLTHMQHRLYQARWMPDDFHVDTIREDHYALLSICPLLLQILRDQEFARTRDAASVLNIDFPVKSTRLDDGRIEYDLEGYQNWWSKLPVEDKRYFLANILRTESFAQ